MHQSCNRNVVQMILYARILNNVHFASFYLYKIFTMRKLIFIMFINLLLFWYKNCEKETIRIAILTHQFCVRSIYTENNICKIDINFLEVEITIFVNISQFHDLRNKNTSHFMFYTHTHTHSRFIKTYLIKTNMQHKHKMLCNSLYIIGYQYFRRYIYDIPAANRSGENRCNGNLIWTLPLI